MKRQTAWQAITIACLVIGYSGYYICRSNLSVASPLILGEYASAGVDKAALGLIGSVGVLAYAVGKAVTGIAGDFAGGRTMFILGMIGSIAATVAFGLSGGLAAFVIAWAINRFVQSSGWGALVKIAAHWFSPERYGTVMAVLSLSYLFGDAAGRLILGALIAEGLGWRGVFFAAAAILGIIAVVSAILLKASPNDVGLPLPVVSTNNVYGGAGVETRPATLADLIVPYLRSPSFWLVCLMSFGLTLVRETFNAWTPTYLVETYGMTEAAAAQSSSLFPFAGGISVLVVGWLSDRLGAESRTLIAVPFLILSAIALGSLGSGVANSSELYGLALVSATAFLLIGPYSLLAGAIAVDLGARRGSSTAAGLIDSAGYIGGIFSGYAVGSVAQTNGWNVAFTLLAFVVTASAIAALTHWRQTAHA